jgi:hypothetical protein
MPEAPKARSAPRGGLRVCIGVVLGLAALQALRGGQKVERPPTKVGTSPLVLGIDGAPRL